MYFNLITLNFLLMIIIINAEQCQTPNGEVGECVPIKLCPSLLEMVRSKNTSTLEFVSSSMCTFDGINSTVCCHYQTETKSLIDPVEEKTNFRIISNQKYCGYQHSDDYEHSSNSSSVITEFPWLARLVHTRKSSSSSSIKMLHACAGSLITVRYVLTTADCTKVKPGGYALSSVVLGEYHVTNKTDCVTDDTNIEECSDPVDVYELEKIIVHPQYSNTPVLNNIALLRLNKNVAYSDYIRPICLPYPDTKSAEIDDILTTSGWGFSNSKGERANIKKRVVSTIVSNEACAKAYKKSQRIEITPNHLCTLEMENSTDVTCMGDSGAPVMFSQKLQWHQEGIVSNGKAQCGSDMPVIHIRVRKYLKWIEENVQP